MNIFYLDENPQLCAQYHCDKHVVKMILETAQLLSTAIHLSTEQDFADIYNPTFPNHPCNKWARKTLANFEWLQKLGLHLCSEYTYRYNKTHKSQDIIEKVWLYRDFIPSGLFTVRPQCMPDIYKDDTSVINAYRNYYLGAKTHILKYTRRPVPYWIANMSLGENK